MKTKKLYFIYPVLLILFFIFNGVYFNTGKTGNQEKFKIEADTPFTYSLSEGFTGTTFPPTGWTMSTSGSIHWSRVPISAFCLGSGAAMIDFYNLPSGSQQLITPIFQTTISGDSLIFADNYDATAYVPDQLQINTSTNGGSTWNVLVTLGYTELKSCNTPPCGLCVDWKFQRFVLPVGTNRIQFNGISGWGYDLIIDTICVKTTLIGIKKINSDIPKEFALYQNYPNPFNPSTTISYEIPKPAFVKVAIYDILGNEVALIVNEKQQPGKYDVTWDASNYASGVFFYKLTSGDFIQIKKMVVLK